jgi:chloramphenicol-sensitive protein RarD
VLRQRAAVLKVYSSFARGLTQSFIRLAQALTHSFIRLARALTHSFFLFAQGLAHLFSRFAQGLAHPLAIDRGTLFATGAYLCWGVFPLYFRLLKHVSPYEILLHRVWWSVLLLVPIVLALRRLPVVLGAFRQPKVLATFCLSAALIAFNWWIYIFAINTGRVVEASLGYFINPLVVIMIGALFFRERLPALQWAAIGLAALGVLWITYDYGHPPYIALLLAASFASYGVLRKTAALAGLEGLTLETLLLFPLALAGLARLWTQQGSALQAAGQGDLSDWLLIACTGPLTALPLWLFAEGARRIPMTRLGLLQYLSPSLQFSIGVFVFHEPFGMAKAIGFALIWTGLGLFARQSLKRER